MRARCGKLAPLLDEEPPLKKKLFGHEAMDFEPFATAAVLT
jgi:hypothetical protein